MANGVISTTILEAFSDAISCDYRAHERNQESDYETVGRDFDELSLEEKFYSQEISESWD